MTLICQNQNCGEPFEGRPNREYCSPSCKSAVNNRSYNERNTDVRQAIAKIRANRKILLELHKVFQNEPFPTIVIEKSKLETNFNSGTSADGTAFIFLDIALKHLPNQSCKIIQ
jgi:hypothetical protein